MLANWTLADSRGYGAWLQQEDPGSVHMISKLKGSRVEGSVKVVLIPRQMLGWLLRLVNTRHVLSRRFVALWL